MSDPKDPFPQERSNTGNSYAGKGRPRPKKSGSIWACIVAAMFVIIFGSYLTFHWRGNTDPAPGGPMAGTAATDKPPTQSDH